MIAPARDRAASRPRATRARATKTPLRVLRDATPSQLADAVQRNQAEWIGFEGRLPGVELHRERHVTWICSNVPGRPNSVALARFQPDEADGHIKAILERYRQLDASTVWWVGPLSRPTDLGRRLRSAGFHCFKHFPGMAMNLGRLPVCPARGDGLQLAQVSDFSIFSRYEHPFFGPVTTERRRNFVHGEAVLCTARPKRAFAFVAMIDGEPLGHALVFLGAGVAGIYDVGVVRRARGRGIGKAVTIAALKHARRLGYRWAVLQASGEGEHLYRKLGFQEACRISLWFHSRHHRDGEAMNKPQGSAMGLALMR